MATSEDKWIVVTGATGRLGRAVTRHLLQDGWRVRALTRNPDGRKARVVAALGAEVVRGDMNDTASLRAPFQGAHGVFSLQNPAIGGVEASIQQGKNVADAAAASKVRHLVYGSAGFGKPGTGVGSWDSKLEVEAYMKALDIPLTILRPTALMELMNDKEFYPAVSTWHLMPKLAGSTTKIPWLASGDFGAIAARAFADPGGFVGQDLKLASDCQSIDECRSMFRSVVGRKPPRFPMPVWMFERFVGTDLTTMWRWLRTGSLESDPGVTRTILPGALSVEEWLRLHGART